MTDLLTPEVVKEWQQRNESLRGGAWFNNTIDTLCRNYLTLWEKHEKKKAALKDRGVIEMVLEICEEERDALKVRVTQLEQEIGALLR